MLFDDAFTNWLLDADTPTIRALTYRHLLDRSPDDPDLLAAQSEIMTAGPVPTILSAQAEEGHWHDRKKYYSPKYTSTHWSMMLLAEFDADGSHPAIRRGVDAMLNVTRGRALNTQHVEQLNIACFWGNLLRYVAQFGRADDPRVETVVNALADSLTRSESRCNINGDLPCAWGTVRSLWGLAALPAEQRTPAVQQAIEDGLTLLVDDYDPIHTNYPTASKPHSLWGKLSFPLFYQADVLFVLRIAAELDVLDRPGAQRALEWLADRRGKDGRWRGASPYRRHTHDGIVEVKETNRWVSLHAAMLLKRAQRQLTA